MNEQFSDELKQAIKEGFVLALTSRSYQRQPKKSFFYSERVLGFAQS